MPDFQKFLVRVAVLTTALVLWGCVGSGQPKDTGQVPVAPEQGQAQESDIGTLEQSSPSESSSPSGLGDLEDIYVTPFETIEVDSLDLSGIPESNIISVTDLHEMIAADTIQASFLVVDIRPLAAFIEGSIEGSKSITGGKQFELRLREVPRDKTVILIAQKNENIAKTWNVLKSNGYDMAAVYIVDGGIVAWTAEGFSLHSNPEFAC